MLTISGSHGGPGRRVDKDQGQPFTLQLAPAPAGPGNAAFVVWARLGVPDPTEQLPSPFGTMMFPPPFLQPADPRLLTLTNSLFVDPTALLAPSPLPWSVPVSALGFPLVLTLQGALLDTAAPAGLSLSNVVILRVQ